MQRGKIVLLLLVVLTFGASAIRAQQDPPSTTNAALRYWMAFALMQDPPANPATQTLLLAVATSNAPWDEQKFGAIVEQNREAILTMQRGTVLPECNWGLEYQLGPEAPVAHIAKARVLARLNALYGMHQVFRHDAAGAVGTWLAGVRFSQHLDQGASLFGVLTANASLIAHLNAMKSAIESGALDDSQAARIDTAVRALPTYGFDWGEAVRIESAVTVIAFNEFAKSADPRRMYESAFGETAPSTLAVPTSVQIAQYQALMEKAAAAFRQNYAPLPELPALEAQIRKLNPVIDRAQPSLVRVNGSRQEAGQARQQLLDAIANRQRH